MVLKVCICSLSWGIYTLVQYVSDDEADKDISVHIENKIRRRLGGWVRSYTSFIMCSAKVVIFDRLCLKLRSGIQKYLNSLGLT